MLVSYEGQTTSENPGYQTTQTSYSAFRGARTYNSSDFKILSILFKFDKSYLCFQTYELDQTNKAISACTTMDCIRNVYDVLPVPPTVQKEARISGIRLLPSCVVDIWSQTLRSSNRSAEPQHCAPAHKHWHPNMSGLTCQ